MASDQIDTTVPHSARIWNYWLGGKDNYPVDREAGDRFLEVYPDMSHVARSVRYFLARAVRYLAGEAGVRQFLDVGTGLPTVDNTHEVAQRVAPESRIVYVDNDPLVLVHARALLTSRPEGSCAYVDADVREPAAIIEAARATLDFSQPVALMMLGIMGHIQDDDEARSIVHQLTAALPSGSYLGVQHPTGDFYPAGVGAQGSYRNAGIPFQYRTRAEFERFVAGLELVPPGLVPMVEWRAEDEAQPRPSAAEAGAYAALGRKP